MIFKHPKKPEAIGPEILDQPNFVAFLNLNSPEKIFT